MNLVADHEKRIPKFCNQVLFSGNSENIIMTLVHKEQVEGTEGVMIERIFLDRAHAISIANQLLEITK